MIEIARTLFYPLLAVDIIAFMVFVVFLVTSPGSRGLTVSGLIIFASVAVMCIIAIFYGIPAFPI